MFVEETVDEYTIGQGESFELLMTQLRDQKNEYLPNGAGFSGKFVLEQDGVEVVDNTITTELSGYSSSVPHDGPGNGAVLPCLTKTDTLTLSGGYQGFVRIFYSNASFDAYKCTVTVMTTLPDKSTSA